MAQGPTGAGNNAFKDKEKPQAVRTANITAARAVADAIRTSLGPRGMDKMIQTGKGETIITNDGNTMLKDMSVMHPAAKMLVDLANAQDIEAGDGTTSVVVICGSLLGAAERLLAKGLHPTIISESFQRAAAEAVKTLQEMSVPINLADRATLLKAASTSLSSKIVSQEPKLAPMAVDAVMRSINPNNAQNVDLRNIRILKRPGGVIDDSEMVEGLVLNQQVIKSAGGPTRIEKAKIGLIQFQLSPPKPDMENQIVVNDYRQMDKILKEERTYLLNMVNAMSCLFKKAFSAMPSTIFPCTFSTNSASCVSKISSVTKSSSSANPQGANLLPTSIPSLKTRWAPPIWSRKRAALARASSALQASSTVTLTLRALSLLLHVVPTRSFSTRLSAVYTTLCVIRCLVKKRALLPGGGAPEMSVSTHLSQVATTAAYPDSICWKAFADALEVVPVTLAENAGLNSIKVVTELRARHAKGETNVGVSIKRGGVGVMGAEGKDATGEGVMQPLLVSTSAIELASETVKMILRIDDIALSR
jgi:T-complex protein 1 subunit delta